jgi:hydroxymethylpyrimidine pyrophosphatase-like HAD family hydrolase
VLRRFVPLLAGVDLPLPVIELNGAFVTDLATGAHVDALLLERTQSKAAVDALSQMGVEALLTTWDGDADHVYYRDALEGAARWWIREKEERDDPRLRLVDDLHLAAATESVAMVTAFVRHGVVAAAMTKLRAVLGGPVTLTSAEHGYCEGWTEITIQGVGANKGDGIRRLQRSCGMPDLAVVAIGDHLNDLPMFDIAETTIAPANSVPEILARADVVVGANEVDGVIEHLLTAVAPALPGWK